MLAAALAICAITAMPAHAQTNTERIITIGDTTRDTLAAVGDMGTALDTITGDIAGIHAAVLPVLDTITATLDDMVATLAALVQVTGDIRDTVSDVDAKSDRTYGAITAHTEDAADRHGELMAAISGVDAPDLSSIDVRLAALERTITANADLLDDIRSTQLTILLQLHNITATPAAATPPPVAEPVQVPAAPKTRSANLVQHSHSADVTYQRVITAPTISHGQAWGDTQYVATLALTCDTDTYLDSADASPLPGHRAWTPADPETIWHPEHIVDHMGNTLHNNKFATGSGNVVFDREHPYNGMLLAAGQELQFKVTLSRNGAIDKPQNAAVQNMGDIAAISVKHKSFYPQTSCTWSGATATVPGNAPEQRIHLGLTKPAGETIGAYNVTISCTQPMAVAGLTASVVDDDGFEAFTSVNMRADGEFAASFGFDNGALALRTGELPTDVRNLELYGDTYAGVLATLTYRSSGTCSTP